MAVSKRTRHLLLRVGLYGPAILVAALVLLRPDAVMRKLGIGGARTVRSVLANTEPRIETKFRQVFEAAGRDWPPEHVALLAFKTERKLEMWAGPGPGKLVRLATYPITAASGSVGPKVKEGDRQVPEGIYRLPNLNPNSQFHLSILVDYPNADDLERSVLGRELMGGEIFVHRNSVFVGCIAIGDEAIEEVFTVVALVSPKDREIVIAPYDFRAPPPSVRVSQRLRSYTGRSKRLCPRFRRGAGRGVVPDSTSFSLEWPRRLARGERAPPRSLVAIPPNRSAQSGRRTSTNTG